MPLSASLYSRTLRIGFCSGGEGESLPLSKTKVYRLYVLPRTRKFSKYSHCFGRNNACKVGAFPV